MPRLAPAPLARAVYRVRSAAANVSAEILLSARSTQPKASKVAAAQIKPRIAIHQMCQIIAKPVMTAKNAVTKPLGLLRGTLMAS